jgi:V/A-type H+-transporting ATPase subunit B
MTTVVRRYHGASGAAGPLLYVRRTPTVALGEWVEIRVPGQLPRRGQVIDAGRDISVVQVLEDTMGLPPARAEVTLTGLGATAIVGRELLGRALSGAGEPIDDLPAPLGEASRPVWGAPLNPVRRARPRDFIETGISALDGMNTLVRGQKPACRRWSSPRASWPGPARPAARPSPSCSPASGSRRERGMHFSSASSAAVRWSAACCS